jgi:serine/threonine protein kinase
MPGQADQGSNQLIDGRFRLVERIGSGSSSQVYRAFDEGDRIAVAVKILRPELLNSTSPEAASAVARFRREITLLERLGPSRYVPDLIAGKSSGNSWYIAMELVEGRTLRLLIEQFPQGLVPAAFMMLGLELARGLAEIHMRGVLHRDLAPDNVAVIEFGGSVEVRFLDFGIGKTLEAEVDPVTRQATIAGTPQYLAPEQTRGLDIDEAADVYALGVILYELATGQVPIAVHSFAELARIRRETPRSLSKFEAATWLPAEILDLVDRTLAKTPEERPSLEALLETFSDYGRRPEWSLGRADLIAAPPQIEKGQAVGPGTSERRHRLSAGESLGPYQLEASLNQLGVQETWLVRLEGSGEPRVLTWAPLEGEERLHQLEVGLAATARPAAAGLRPTLDARLIEGGVVWVSPWVEGTTLAEELAVRGALDPARVLAIAREIVEILTDLHRARPPALHGYLHPGHIVLDDFDGITLLNAGRSFAWRRCSPFARERLEFAFLAPEQAISNRTMPESETYALAAVIDAMIRGVPPTRGSREAQLRMKLAGPPPSPPGPQGQALTPSLSRILRRALDPDPIRRPAPFVDFAAELVDILAEKFVGSAESHIAD